MLFLPKFKWGMIFVPCRALFTKLLVEIQPFCVEFGYIWISKILGVDLYEFKIKHKNRCLMDAPMVKSIIWIFTLVHISNVQMYTKSSKRSLCLERMFARIDKAKNNYIYKQKMSRMTEKRYSWTWKFIFNTNHCTRTKLLSNCLIRKIKSEIILNVKIVEKMWIFVN